MRAALILLLLLAPAVSVHAGGQVFTIQLDGWSLPCDGGNYAWHLDVSDLEAHGATIVMDLSDGHGSAALLTDDGGGQWGIIAQSHNKGSGRFTDHDELSGNWIHVRSNLVLWGNCNASAPMNVYATMRWRPRTP